MNQRFFLKPFLFLGLFFFILSCSHNEDKDLDEAAKDHRVPKTKLERLKDKTKGYIFGEPLFSIGSKKPEDSNIGVNSYLWRASLDILSPLPKINADPFGGVIVTDWHVLAQDEKERFKMEIIIIGRQLRSDALKVSIFKQRLSKGVWVDEAVSKETIDQVEETILKRARDIRIQEEK